MGTNYYRVPTVKEMEERRDKLLDRIKRLKMTPCNIERKFSIEYGIDHHGFHSFDTYDPWSEFLENTSIHLGKRSGGWQFAWNHNNWKYYTNKKELIEYTKKGRVVDEYGDELTVEEFFEMAFNWCPEGWTSERYLREELISKGKRPLSPDSYRDIFVDDLRFLNTTEFS